MGKLKIEISRSRVDDTEKELYEVLRAEFGVEGRRASSDADEHEPVPKINPNTLAIIGIVVPVVVGLPNAIDSTLNLAKCVESTHKVKQLVAWGRRRSTPGLKIVFVSPKGGSLDLKSADPGAVVDAFTEAHEDDTAEREP